MNLLFISLLFVLLTSCSLADADFLPAGHSQTFQPNTTKPDTGIDGPLITDSSILQQKIKTIYRKAIAEGYDTHFAFLADLGLHSGSNRFYIIDLSNKAVVRAGLVTHGSSAAYLPNGKRQYSNTNGSFCSSLGMYRIGASYHGKFGLAYKLYGLSGENSNAFTRAIVLHSHSCVPDTEMVNPICQSWGCPTVSPLFLKKLSQYIDTAQKPMLLCLFDSKL